MTIFHQPKEQWKTLLQQRSWADLCGVDFVHVMERGSTERVKIFIKSLLDTKENKLEQHIPSLSAGVTADIFNNGKWNASKIDKLLVFLLQCNQKYELFGQYLPYAPLIEAVVRHSDYKIKATGENKLLALAVVRDSDLLGNLLQRMDPSQRSEIEEQLFSKNKHFMNTHFPKVFFTRTTVELLPKYPDLVVQHMCNNLRWNVAVDLSISQRIKLAANNVMERMLGSYAIRSPDDEIAFNIKTIEKFNQFVELHGEALSQQHWKDILRLFKKVAKKYDVVHVEFLRNHTLKDTLQRDVVGTHEHTPSAPPKRKM